MAVAVKKTAASARLIRFNGAVFLGLLVGGCASENSPRVTTERPMPPMPTMGPMADVTKPKVPESEIAAMALRFASNNDTAGVLRTLDLTTESAERARVSTDLVQTLASQKPALAAEIALALPIGPTRSAAVEIAAASWVQRDADSAIGWSLALSDPVAANLARRAVARELVRDNPRGALGRLQALPTDDRRDDLVAIAAGAWARQDAEGAMSWLREQPDNNLRQRLTSSMAFEIAQVSPSRAIALAETLPPGRDRWLIFSELAQTWVAVDQNAAFAWASKLEAPEARDAAIAGINTGLGVASRRRTSDAALNRESRIRGGRAAYAMSSPLDPPEFTAWLASQSRAMSRDEAILEFVRQRSSQDVVGIRSWLANLTGEPSAQRAREIYFEETLRGSPAAAASWLRSLPNSERSNEMVEKTARQWLQTDPTAAATWLRETNLPAFRQEELIRQAPH
ncbi:MAG: hypothetical protein ABIZ81_17540 [Opitutaceae bacterium]